MGGQDGREKSWLHNLQSMWITRVSFLGFQDLLFLPSSHSSPHSSRRNRSTQRATSPKKMEQRCRTKELQLPFPGRLPCTENQKQLKFSKSQPLSHTRTPTAGSLACSFPFSVPKGPATCCSAALFHTAALAQMLFLQHL